MAAKGFLCGANAAWVLFLVAITTMDFTNAMRLEADEKICETNGAAQKVADVPIEPQNVAEEKGISVFLQESGPAGSEDAAEANFRNAAKYANVYRVRKILEGKTNDAAFKLLKASDPSGKNAFMLAAGSQSPGHKEKAPIIVALMMLSVSEHQKRELLQDIKKDDSRAKEIVKEAEIKVAEQNLKADAKRIAQEQAAEDFRDFAKTELDGLNEILKDMLEDKTKEAAFEVLKEKDLAGKNALMLAAGNHGNDAADIVRSMLESIDDKKKQLLEEKDSQGRTVLHHAVNKEGPAGVVDELLKDADASTIEFLLTEPEKDGSTAFKKAAILCSQTDPKIRNNLMEKIKKMMVAAKKHEGCYKKMIAALGKHEAAENTVKEAEAELAKQNQ
eukprot:TRINITY_DN46013_c0_g1_i1.p1 TRINITY_DN46013_c0_g1~~TRINITY_DN46013_c0_g1_i1.p1  ORF type:complete len:389 (+),score=104.54 TRINITY_DN46013_c0_g1_i1:52-1218(+)